MGANSWNHLRKILSHVKLKKIFYKVQGANRQFCYGIRAKTVQRIKILPYFMELQVKKFTPFRLWDYLKLRSSVHKRTPNINRNLLDHRLQIDDKLTLFRLLKI